jgi:hypothetical protein
MAITLVGSNSGAASNGAGVTIDLTGISLAENDLVVVMGGFPGTGNSGVTGYSYTVTDAGASVSGSFSVCYKFMSSSPDTSVTCLGHGNTSNACAYTVMAFRGVDTGTPIDTTSVSTQNFSGTPNSASITTVTDNAAVITCGLSAVSDAAVTAPSGYGDTVSGNASDTFAATSMSAWKLKTPAGAENPAAWADLSSAGWIASTVALRPGASGSFGDGALSGGSITGTASFVYASDGAGNLEATGTGTALFAGSQISVVSSPLSATGTGDASFIGAPFQGGALAATGTGTASFDGISLATSGAFSLAGSAVAAFVGSLAGSGNIAATGTATASFGGSSIYSSPALFTGSASASFIGLDFTSAVASFSGSATAMFVAGEGSQFLSHVSEVIESRGAVTVNIG